MTSAVGEVEELPTPAARVIAFYLPQFHPIPLNDRLFVPGFTEWYSVAAARPLFRGHRQPVVPGELGYYDLRVAETRARQAELARDHGVEAFCYWHYWSDGERLIERPFDEVLSSGEPDFPFCLGWANHDWDDTHGDPTPAFEQRYPGPDDWRAHFDAIEPALHDRRHLTVDGAPLFYLFRPAEIPRLGEFCDTWRRFAVESGLSGIHFVGQSRGQHDGDAIPEMAEALDAAVHVTITPSRGSRGIARRLRDRLRGGPPRFDYSSFLSEPVAMVDWARSSYPNVVPNWDATPRWGRAGEVVLDSSPELFEAVLGRAVDVVRDRDPQRRIVFVKSWNEWAEGNYLEPDLETGLARLEAVARTVGVSTRR